MPPALYGTSPGPPAFGKAMQPTVDQYPSCTATMGSLYLLSASRVRCSSGVSFFAPWAAAGGLARSVVAVASAMAKNNKKPLFANGMTFPLVALRLDYIFCGGDAVTAPRLDPAR